MPMPICIGRCPGIRMQSAISSTAPGWKPRIFNPLQIGELHACSPLCGVPWTRLRFGILGACHIGSRRSSARLRIWLDASNARTAIRAIGSIRRHIFFGNSLCRSNGQSSGYGFLNGNRGTRSRSTKLARDVVFPHSGLQRRPLQSQASRRAARASHKAFCFLQRLQNPFPFGIVRSSRRW